MERNVLLWGSARPSEQVTSVDKESWFRANRLQLASFHCVAVAGFPLQGEGAMDGDLHRAARRAGAQTQVHVRPQLGPALRPAQSDSEERGISFGSLKSFPSPPSKRQIQEPNDSASLCAADSGSIQRTFGAAISRKYLTKENCPSFVL